MPIDSRKLHTASPAAHSPIHKRLPMDIPSANIAAQRFWNGDLGAATDLGYDGEELQGHRMRLKRSSTTMTERIGRKVTILLS